MITKAPAMIKHHYISGLKFEDNFLIVTIDGKQKRFEFKEISPALEKAILEGRNKFEISPSGYGIHWPSLDEDISIDGLLGIVHTPQLKGKTA
jgi:Protein of unknown function (DUF2442)